MGTGLNIELFKNHFESKYLFIPIPMNALRCIYGGLVHLRGCTILPITIETNHTRFKFISNIHIV